MSTESTNHLDIEDLLAAVDGTLGDDRAKAHLAACSICRSDAQRWTVVGLGVRHLVAEVAPSATPLFAQSLLNSPRVVPSVPPTRARDIAGHPRRRALVGVAAAAVLVIGGWYGVTLARGGGEARPATHHLTPTTASAGLTAVNGCPNLAGVSGTLEQRNGSDLVIIKTSDGQSVAITTAPSTRMIGSEANGTLDDISNGAQVAVNGAESNGTITAATVTVGAIHQVKPFEPPQPSDLNARVAIGTVTDAHTGGFTVVESDGTNVAVTTNGATTVITLRALSVRQLQIGGFTVAVGNTPGPGGTLVAGAVEQVPNPIAFPQSPISGKGGGAGCSAENVVTAALLSHT